MKRRFVIAGCGLSVTATFGMSGGRFCLFEVGRSGEIMPAPVKGEGAPLIATVFLLLAPWVLSQSPANAEWCCK